MMEIPRYNAVREEIISLWNILNNRLYSVRVTPSMMMTVDELRDRETHTRDDTIIAGDPYEDYTEVRLNCPRIIEILPNLVRERDLAFARPNEDIVEIFESAQRYLRLWVEIAVNVGEFRIPPLDELKDIENLAYTLYPEYKKIKQYFNLRNYYSRKTTGVQKEEDAFLSLAALFGIVSSSEGRADDSVDFISHLEDLGISTGRTTVSAEDLTALQSAIPSQSISDGLFTPQIEAQFPDLPDWNFKR